MSDMPWVLEFLSLTWSHSQVLVFCCQVLQLLSNFRSTNYLFLDSFMSAKIMTFDIARVQSLMVDSRTEEALEQMGIRAKMLKNLINRGVKIDERLTVDQVKEFMLMDRVKRCSFIIHAHNHFFVVIVDVDVERDGQTVLVKSRVFDGFNREVPSELMTRMDLVMTAWVLHGLGAEIKCNCKWILDEESTRVLSFGPRQHDGFSCGEIVLMNTIRVGWKNNMNLWDASNAWNMRQHLLVFLSRVGSALCSYGNEILGFVSESVRGNGNLAIDPVKIEPDANWDMENDSDIDMMTPIEQKSPENDAERIGVVMFCRLRMASEISQDRAAWLDEMRSALVHVEFYWMKLRSMMGENFHRCIFFVSEDFENWWNNNTVPQKKKKFMYGSLLLAKCFIPINEEIPAKHPVNLLAKHILVQMLRFSERFQMEEPPNMNFVDWLASVFDGKEFKPEEIFCDHDSFRCLMLTPIVGRHVPRICPCAISRQRVDLLKLEAHLSIDQGLEPLGCVAANVVEFLENHNAKKNIIAPSNNKSLFLTDKCFMFCAHLCLCVCRIS